MSDSVVAKKLQSMSTRALFLIIRIKTGCYLANQNKEFTLIYPLNASALNQQSMLLKQSRNTLYNL